MSNSKKDTDDTIYTVERLLKSRTKKGHTEYFVQWKNWGPANNTWEPEENILDPRLIDEFNSNKKSPAKRGPKGGSVGSSSSVPTKRNSSGVPALTKQVTPPKRSRRSLDVPPKVLPKDEVSPSQVTGSTKRTSIRKSAVAATAKIASTVKNEWKKRKDEESEEEESEMSEKSTSEESMDEEEAHKMEDEIKETSIESEEGCITIRYPPKRLSDGAKPSVNTTMTSSQGSSKSETKKDRKNGSFNETLTEQQPLLSKFDDGSRQQQSMDEEENSLQIDESTSSGGEDEVKRTSKEDSKVEVTTFSATKHLVENSPDKLARMDSKDKPKDDHFFIAKNKQSTTPSTHTIVVVKTTEGDNKEKKTDSVESKVTRKFGNNEKPDIFAYNAKEEVHEFIEENGETSIAIVMNP
uniref:Chromo domain-containing protein n=1 Tax=Rhabditophanes sp. KR3021 TaxID=114890 RepID=A0AC35TRN2_9BILA